MKTFGSISRGLGWTTSLLFVLSVLAVGCPAPDFPQCRDSDDCKENGPAGNVLLACCNGQCQECCTDEDCPEDKPKCQEFRCVECTEDADCPEEKPFCENGLCSYECEIDADCDRRGKAGMICKDHKCQWECESDADCGEGMECKDNRCVTACACTSDDDCPGGQVCRECQCVEADCTLDSIHFDFDRYNLRSGDRDILDRNGACLQQRSGLSVTIEGHCDERGTEEYNIALGDKRARAAKRYLNNLGIAGNRLKTISYGEGRPVCSEFSEDCWSQNRRADFVE